MAARKKTNRRAPARRTRRRRAPAPPPRRRRRTAKKKDASWKPALAALAGGIGTAGAGYLMVRGGVSPMTAAVGLTAAGSVAALTTDGRAQSVALGAAGLGTGQLALALMTTQATKADDKKQLATATAKRLGGKRNDDFASNIEDAFQRVRDQLAMEDEVVAFSDDFDEEDAA